MISGIADPNEWECRIQEVMTFFYAFILKLSIRKMKRDILKFIIVILRKRIKT